MCTENLDSPVLVMQSAENSMRPDATLGSLMDTQSGERIRGRRRIQESRTVQPNKKRFFVRRIMGNGDLWVTEFVLTYDGSPSYAVHHGIQGRQDCQGDAILLRPVRAWVVARAPG